MSNAFILCNLVWKVQKGHAGNREGSFKAHGQIAMIHETYFERRSGATIDYHLCNSYQLALPNVTTINFRINYVDIYLICIQTSYIFLAGLVASWSLIIVAS